MKRVVAVLVFMFFMAIVGMIVTIDSRIKVIEYEMKQQEIINSKKVEEMQKSQRLTEQDVIFLEDMIKEISEKNY